MNLPLVNLIYFLAPLIQLDKDVWRVYTVADVVGT